MVNAKKLSLVIVAAALSLLSLSLEPALTQSIQEVNSESASEPPKQEPLDFLVVTPDTPRPTSEQAGNRIRFLALGAENAGQYSEFELTIPVGGSFASHHQTKGTKAFLLLDGNLTIQSEDQTLELTSGAFVYLPNNRPYSLTNTGTEPSKLLGFSVPAGGMEEFVQAKGKPVLDQLTLMPSGGNLTGTTTARPFSPDKGNEDQGNEEFLVVPPGAPERPAYDILGERFTPLATGEETDDQFSLIQVLSPVGAGAPLRINTTVDETFFIEEGELTFQLEDKTVVVPAGSLVFLPRGRAHSYVNNGTNTARLVSLIMPGGELENFFREAAQLVTDPSAPIAPPSQDAERIRAIAAKYNVQVLSP